MTSFSFSSISTSTAVLSIFTAQLTIILLKLFKYIASVLIFVTGRVRLLSRENTDIKWSHKIALPCSFTVGNSCLWYTSLDETSAPFIEDTCLCYLVHFFLSWNNYGCYCQFFVLIGENLLRWNYLFNWNHTLQEWCLCGLIKTFLFCLQKAWQGPAFFFSDWMISSP